MQTMTNFFTNLIQTLQRAESQKNVVATDGNSPDSESRSTKVTFGVGAVIEQRYHLNAELGRGGMAIVYRAHDSQLDRDVALKIINFDEAGYGARDQFLRESQITAQLNHPNIVAVYATDTVNTGAPQPTPYIVMELIEGKALDELGELPFAQIIDLARQICAALDYAHTQNLVHRDLKPGNVLVEKHGFRLVAKLMDFGLARPSGLSDAELGRGVVGTAFYVAPEVIAGNPADAAADLYALGVMLYEMVTGHLPFSDFDAESVLEQHLNEAAPPPSQSRADVPPALEALILRLLAKNPQDRYGSAREVDGALEQIAAAIKRDATHTNLPPRAIGFTGRENEIVEIKQALESNRLVTLVGAAGVGKTQLALQVARQLRDQFANGVWLIELDTCTDPASVSSVVASILRVPAESHHARVALLTQQLRGKNILLILDHCEQIAGACRMLVETILQSCSGVSILATSQCALGAANELAYAVSIRE